MSGQGKSSTLEDLGVTRIQVEESSGTPKSRMCTRNFVAAMAVALGCSLGTPQANAAGLEVPPKPTRTEAALDTMRSVVGIEKDSSDGSKVLVAGATVVGSAMAGNLGGVATQMTAEAAAGGAIGASTKDVGIGRAGGSTVVNVGVATLTGNPVAAMSAISSGMELGNKAAGFDESGSMRRGAESAAAIGGAIISGGVLAIGYAGKTVYDNAKAQIAQNKREEEKRAAEREKRLEGIAEAEKLAVWNTEREGRQQWSPELREYDQQRVLKAANEEVGKSGFLTSPETIRRYAIEAQREADGLPVEPWYEKHQAFKVELDAEIQRTISTPDENGYSG